MPNSRPVALVGESGAAGMDPAEQSHDGEHSPPSGAERGRRVRSGCAHVSYGRMELLPALRFWG
jgi:hypothetical protein